MEWRRTFIKFWFTTRAFSTYMTAFKGPGPITSNDIKGLGSPDAVFTGKDCRFAESFARQFIIISTNFCGDWGRFSSAVSVCQANSNRSRGTTCVERHTGKMWGNL